MKHEVNDVLWVAVTNPEELPQWGFLIAKCRVKYAIKNGYYEVEVDPPCADKFMTVVGEGSLFKDHKELRKYLGKAIQAIKVWETEN